MSLLRGLVTRHFDMPYGRLPKVHRRPTRRRGKLRIPSLKLRTSFRLAEGIAATVGNAPVIRESLLPLADGHTQVETFAAYMAVGQIVLLRLNF